MADLNKKPKRRKKAKKTATADPQRLTDESGRLKFMKTSKYLKTITQGES